MSIEERINDGLSGKYKGLNNGFDRLNKLLFGIQRSTYYLIGGQSGTFKTTLTDYMVINAMEDAKKQGIPLNVYYYSFEIDKLTKQCNWLSVLVYQKYNVIVPPEKIKGLGDNRLTKDELDMVNTCIPELEEMFNKIKFDFTPVNPTGIYNNLWRTFENKGKFMKEKYTDNTGKEREKIIKFVPNNPNEMNICVVDHLYYLQKEREFQTKETIDKFSEYCVALKNMFGMTFINIQQFNRSLSSVERQKFKGADMSPQESDFKDTGNTYQDADVVLGIMNPYKLDMEECLDYDISKLGRYMIMLKIIKNRLSSDGEGIGLYANPKAGKFEELPDPDKINYTNYM